ncbi:MAG: PHP domain-containing protein [Haloferacaceae archaeon]
MCSSGEPPVADLHVHTTVSDGSLSLAAVPAAAEAAGVPWVGLTDHDRYHPDLDAPVTVREGVTLVRGLELRVEAGDQRLDLLGYAVDPTPALDAELDRLQRNRIERTRRIVECVEERLGVDLDVALEPGVGRPHVARAVEASDAPLDFQETFDRLIGDGRPCYVAREVPDVARGVELLSDTCALVSLAHPLRYGDPGAALDVAADHSLDAVELCYPYGDDADTAPVERFVADHDLLATGGSDAHGETVGAAGLTGESFERVAAALPSPEAQG